MAAEQRTTQVEQVRIRLLGQMPTRVDLSEHGTPQARVHLTFGGTLVHIRHRSVARLIREVWEAAGVYGHRLPAQAPPTMLGPTQGTGPVAAVVTLGESVPVNAELVAIQELRRRAIAVRVGPIVWQILDKHAFYAGLQAWSQVESLL